MINKSLTKSVALVGSGVVAGAAVTYFVVNTRLKKKYVAIAEEEIASVKAAHRKFDPQFDFANATMEEHAEETQKRAAYLETLDKLQYAASDAYEPEEKVDHYNYEGVIGVDTPEDFEALGKHDQGYWPAPGEDLNDQLENRLPEQDKTKPYVITVEQFMEDEPDFDKLTFTYYEGDDTLLDERDSIVPEIDKVIGEYSLTRFGKESGDKHIVYVRSTRIDTDFEIIKNEGEYAEVILGLVAEKVKSPIKKMRNTIE